MEETTISLKKYILIYGIILGILFVTYNVIIYMSDGTINRNWIHTVIDLSIRIGIIIFGIKAYKLTNNGFLKLSEAIKIGLGIVLIAGIMAVIWNIILNTIIEPDMMSQKFNTQKQQIIDRNPDMSPEQVNQDMAMIKTYSSLPVMSIIVLTWNLFVGLIISLLGGAIMQKNKDVF